MSYHLTLVRMAVIKNRRTDVGEDIEKSEPCCTVSGSIYIYIHIGAATVEKGMKDSQNI